MSCKDENYKQVCNFLETKNGELNIPNVLPFTQYTPKNETENVVCIVDSECSFCVARFIKLFQTINEEKQSLSVIVITNDSVSLNFYVNQYNPDFSDKISITTLKDSVYLWNGFCYHTLNGQIISSITNPY